MNHTENPSESHTDLDHRAAGLSLAPEELRRYARHLILPEVGRQGQARLKAAKVLLVGAGGLGSPLALYLAAAGVGRLGLVDFDDVDASNLQRQVLYGTSDVGRAKVEAAAERLADLNPHVDLHCHALRLSADNVLDLVDAYDVVVDGSDNFPTRYLVNDACVLRGKPDVWGAVQRFEGQVSVFGAEGGPCYRCLFPEPPPPGLVPSCAEGGVLGVLPGIIGGLQANEVVKLILGAGEPLVGRLLIFDALKLRFRELRLGPSATCPLAHAGGRGREPAADHGELLRRLAGSGAACTAPASGTNREEEDVVHSRAPEEIPFEISVEELKDWFDSGQEVILIDVREPVEYEICQIEGSILIPMGELASRIGELDPERTTVVHCHHGGRSARAVAFLRQRGFSRATNLGGGIDAWSSEIDAEVPRY